MYVNMGIRILKLIDLVKTVVIMLCDNLHFFTEKKVCVDSIHHRTLNLMKPTNRQTVTFFDIGATLQECSRIIMRFRQIRHAITAPHLEYHPYM